MIKKRKIYISGAVTGINDYLEKFNAAEDYLQKQGLYVINPVRVNSALPEDTEYEDFMSMAFAMLDLCNEIYLLKGWENSSGAKREYERAVAKGYTITYQS